MPLDHRDGDDDSHAGKEEEQSNAAAQLHSHVLHRAKAMESRFAFKIGVTISTSVESLWSQMSQL